MEGSKWPSKTQSLVNRVKHLLWGLGLKVLEFGVSAEGFRAASLAFRRASQHACCQNKERYHKISANFAWPFWQIPKSLTQLPKLNSPTFKIREAPRRRGTSAMSSKDSPAACEKVYGFRVWGFELKGLGCGV